MPNDKGYNGWTNYETWNVELWIDNDQYLQSYWEEHTADVWNDTAAGDSYASQTHKESAACKLADMLKDEFEEQRPEVTGMWADLLNAAMSEVNWYEIAENMLEEFEDDTTETSADSPTLAE